MPFKSKKQARFIRAIAHGWKPGKKKGPSQAVARKLMADDKRSGGRFAQGGLATLGMAARAAPLPARRPGAPIPRGPLGSTAQRALKGKLAGRNAPQPNARGNRARGAGAGLGGPLAARPTRASPLGSTSGIASARASMGDQLGRLEGLNARVSKFRRGG